MILGLLLTALFGQAAAKPADPYASLRLYDGGWTVTMRDSAGKTHTDSLVNACHLFGSYFACQQTVNGKVGALVIYVRGDAPGQFYTQNVLPDGRAAGRGELRIEGGRWTYLGHDEENGKTTWYRTTNDFTGKDRIHFESATSTDDKTWTVNMSGDDVRGNSAPQ
jgi:hypothetical protein